MTARLTDRLAARLQSQTTEDADAGMVTSEYVVGTMAAATCAGVLIKVVQSETFRAIVSNFIKSVFSHFGF